LEWGSLRFSGGSASRWLTFFKSRVTVSSSGTGSRPDNLSPLRMRSHCFCAKARAVRPQRSKSAGSFLWSKGQWYGFPFSQATSSRIQPVPGDAASTKRGSAARRCAATGPIEPVFGPLEAFSAKASSPPAALCKSSATGLEMLKSGRAAAATRSWLGSAAPARAASVVVCLRARVEEVGTNSAASAGFSAGEGAAGAANGADPGSGVVCGVPWGCIHSAPTKTAAPAAALHHRGERRRSRGRRSAAAAPNAGSAAAAPRESSAPPAAARLARKRSHAASLGCAVYSRSSSSIRTVQTFISYQNLQPRPRSGKLRLTGGL